MTRLQYWLYLAVMAAIALIVRHAIGANPTHDGQVSALITVICAIIVHFYTMYLRCNDIGLTIKGKLVVFITSVLPFINFLTTVYLLTKPSKGSAE